MEQSTNTSERDLVNDTLLVFTKSHDASSSHDSIFSSTGAAAIALRLRPRVSNISREKARDKRFSKRNSHMIVP